MRNRLHLRTGWHSLRLLVLSAVLFASIPSASATWLDDQITSIQSKINTLQAGLNNTYAKANAAAAQALAAAQQTEGLQELLTRVQTAYQSLDGPIITMINDLIRMMVDLFEQQQQGYEAFITPNQDGDSPADLFRAELIVTLEEIAEFSQQLIDLDPESKIGGAFDLNFDIISILPDRLLFPISKILKEKAGFSPTTVLEQIATLKQDLLLFADAYAAGNSDGIAYATSTAVDIRPVSMWSSDRRASALKTGKGWKVTGRALNNVANLIKVFGEAGGQVEGKIGIHGYIAIHEGWNIPNAIGGVVEIMADLVTWNGERLEGILSDDETQRRDVEAQNRHNEIISNQQLVLAGQERLFDAMKRLDPDLFPAVADTPPAATVAMDAPPSRIQVDLGEPVTLTAGVVESPNAAYQWRKDGVPIQGAVYSSLIIREATAANAGDYDVIITDESGSQVSAASTLALIPGRVMNVSVRQIIPDNGVLITGFVLDSEKQVVVRGVGRSLEAFGIPASKTLQDPVIEIFNSAGKVVARNDNYERSTDSDAAMAAVGAFPITADNDAAIITTLPAGAYTVHIRGADLKGGDCIVEVYDTENN